MNPNIWDADENVERIGQMGSLVDLVDWIIWPLIGYRFDRLQEIATNLKQYGDEAWAVGEVLERFLNSPLSHWGHVPEDFT